MGAIRAHRRKKGLESLEPRLMMTAEVASWAPVLPIDGSGGAGGGSAESAPPAATKMAAGASALRQSRPLQWAPQAAAAAVGKGVAAKKGGPTAGQPRKDPYEHLTGIRYRADSPAALLDVYVPEGSPPPGGWPVVVAIHSGIQGQGGRGYYGAYASSLTLMGYVVVAPDYTLAKGGGISWPRSLDDVREAVRWVRRNADLIGADTTRVAAIGESAGGQLAALLATAGADPESRVEGAITFHAPYDMLGLAASGGRAAKQVAKMLGGSFMAVPDRYRDASPLNQASPGDAPILIIHGTADKSVPVSQARAFARALEDAGVPHGLKIIPGAGSEFRFRSRQGDLVPLMLAFLEDVYAQSARNASASAGS